MDKEDVLVREALKDIVGMILESPKNGESALFMLGVITSDLTYLVQIINEKEGVKA